MWAESCHRAIRSPLSSPARTRRPLAAPRRDGVVVIPHEMEEEVVRRALEKVAGENQSREALLRGEKLADVFRRLGIL